MIEKLTIDAVTVDAMRWDGTDKGARDLQAWCPVFDWWADRDRILAKVYVRAVGGWASVREGQHVVKLDRGWCTAGPDLVAALTVPAEVAA